MGTDFVMRAAPDDIARHRAAGLWRGTTVLDDSWYDTGDLAVPDGAGGYCLAGRKADRIGGAFMVPVADVENALRRHPAIEDVAIVGHRDGTEGCAVVVSTRPVELADLHAFLHGIDMTEWYWPTRVERVGELPRNGMGKVEKTALRRRLAPRT